GSTPATEPLPQQVPAAGPAAVPQQRAAEPIDLDVQRIRSQARGPWQTAEEAARYPLILTDQYGRPTCRCGKNGTFAAHGGPALYDDTDHRTPRWARDWYSCDAVIQIQQRVERDMEAVPVADRLTAPLRIALAWFVRAIGGRYDDD